MQEQEKDPVIGQLLNLYKTGRFGQYKVQLIAMSYAPSSDISNDILLETTCSIKRKRPYAQFVLPDKFCWQALRAYHDNVGHLGLEHKPEFSALKWAITDNNPFTYIMTSAKP